jgi:hypothetical protein
MRSEIDGAAKNSLQSPTLSAPQGRVGKQAAMVWLDPPTKGRLKECAQEADLTIQEILDEAVRDVIRKYSKAGQRR